MNTKRAQTIKTLLGLAAVVAIAQGCAQPAANNPTAASDATTGSSIVNPTGTNTATGSSGGTSYPYGSGATVTIVPSAGLSQFFAARNINNSQVTLPTINVDMSTAESTVIIGGTIDGQFFGVGNVGTTNPVSGETNNEYNKWYTINGKSIYKAFVQDGFGAVLLIVDSTSGVGDGLPGLASGEIYYQNFNLNYPNNPDQGPNSMCWQLTAGNHDCRSYLVNGNMNPASAIYPDPNNHGPDMGIGYQEVGTFSGMDRSLANF